MTNKNQICTNERIKLRIIRKKTRELAKLVEETDRKLRRLL